jgi:hypothetical protein
MRKILLFLDFFKTTKKERCSLLNRVVLRRPRYSYASCIAPLWSDSKAEVPGPKPRGSLQNEILGTSWQSQASTPKLCPTLSHPGYHLKHGRGISFRRQGSRDRANRNTIQARSHSYHRLPKHWGDAPLPPAKYARCYLSTRHSLQTLLSFLPAFRTLGQRIRWVF